MSYMEFLRIVFLGIAAILLVAWIIDMAVVI